MSGSSARPSRPTGRRNGSARSKSQTRSLLAFDRKLGSSRIAGADEAGRGCLAGPLVAAAVLIDYRNLRLADRRALAGLDDSKRLSRQDRDRLYSAITMAAERVCVAVYGAAGIDRRGLHVSNIEALGTALRRLRPEGALCLVDGFELADCEVEHRRLVKGDSTSAAIAAASVVAKVSRDRIMCRAAGRYPGWGFEDHVGYATPAHRAAIARQGVSPIHRLSFNSSAYPSE